MENRQSENENYFQILSMRKIGISLIAAFCLFIPLLVTGCQMGSKEKMEKHDQDDHKHDHKGDRHGHDQ